VGDSAWVTTDSLGLGSFDLPLLLYRPALRLFRMQQTVEAPVVMDGAIHLHSIAGVSDVDVATREGTCHELIMDGAIHIHKDEPASRHRCGDSWKGWDCPPVQHTQKQDIGYKHQQLASPYRSKLYQQPSEPSSPKGCPTPNKEIWTQPTPRCLRRPQCIFEN
jgi:hypothetical protein